MLSCLEAKLEILFGLLSLTKGCPYFCFQLARRLRAHARLWLGIDLAFEACSHRHRKAAFLEEPADGCQGQARSVEVQEGRTVGRDRQEFTLLRVTGSLQGGREGGREVAQELPQCCLQHFR